ncbi:unnamed protein product [Anisakis simplex]|uniref:Uncharacterized protein n=1 Tax=Anisakis simplex TaxID=6269 RepID=A0A0M3JAS2_ANISI|nr:unnamed protein product [Anisakis simplex]
MSGTNATKHSASSDRSDRSDYENVTTSEGFTTTSSTENDASFLTSTRESTANVANSTLKATSPSSSSKLASFKLMKPNKGRLLSQILAFQNDDDDETS